MNGADAIKHTAARAGIDVCFANPGTTELYLVSVMDNVTGLRPALGPFEGCCTGAADGYGRMTGKPAMTFYLKRLNNPFTRPVLVFPAFRVGRMVSQLSLTMAAGASDSMITRR